MINKVATSLIIIAVSIAMYIWGTKMKDRDAYFKGQFKIIGIILTVVGIMCLVESLIDSINNGHNSSVIENHNNSSVLHKDSTAIVDTNPRFIPPNELPYNLRDKDSNSSK